MSLKAKIEAVVYASEDPVTLLQLVGLLGQEAQAELDMADARQGQLDLPVVNVPILVQEVEPGDQDALNAETLGTEVFTSGVLAEPESAVKVNQPSVGRGEAESFEHSSKAVDTEASNLEFAPAEQVDETEPSSGVKSAHPDGTREPSSGELRARERRLREYMRSLLDELVTEYATSDRGLEIREVAGGFRFSTKPEYHDTVRGFVRSLKPPLKVSVQALETLAVVAYKQPVTAPEVSEIRGVDSAGVLGSLITRKLVATAGRKQVIGRPILYKTTKEFLLRFGLKDLSDLPSIEEFERMASDLNEAVQEEIPMAETLDQTRPDGPVGDAPRHIEPMRDVHVAQPDGVPDQPANTEALTPAPDGPGEFTGDESVPPVDNVEVDGRQSGVPPDYDEVGDEAIDSPSLDAEVQSTEPRETAGENEQ